MAPRSQHVVKWVEDTKAEDVLKELNIKFNFQEVSIKNIDWKTTAKNSGRLTRAIDRSQVEDYKLAMKAGNRFPRPILVLSQDGDYVVLAGVHRSTAAAELNCRVIDAYVIECNMDSQKRLVATMTNRREGKRVTADEALEYAAHYVYASGCTIEESAKLHQVNNRTLSKKVLAWKVRSQLGELNRDAGKLPEVILHHIGKFRSNTNVMGAITDAIQGCDLRGDAVRDVCDRVAAKTTEADQLAEIEKVVEELTHPVAALSQPIKQKFARTLRALNNITNGRTSADELQLDPTTEEFSNLKEIWNAVKPRLSQVFGR